MSKFGKLATYFVAISLVFAFSSCEKQVAEKAVELSFNVNNVTSSLSKKSTDPGDSDIPVCTDLVPAKVMININGVDYTLQVLPNIGDGTETEVLKHFIMGDEETFLLSKFEVYDDQDSLIWLAPRDDSYYAELFGLDGLDIEFTLGKFTKTKINVDVLCFEPYDYKNFGYSWFDFDMIKIKTLCFFGNIQCDDHEAWHADGSPYYDQPGYVGYDFPAIFKVEITDGEGEVLNDVEINSNMTWQGVGAPLCVEYPDFLGQVDEYTFTVYVMMPDGTYSEYIAEDFTAEIFNNTDGDMATDFGEGHSLFGGEGDDDGIYHFVYTCEDVESPQ